MRLVELIILEPGRASYSAIVSSYEAFKVCIQKMRLVALIILVPGRASNSETVSSSEIFPQMKNLAKDRSNDDEHKS